MDNTASSGCKWLLPIGGMVSWLGSYTGQDQMGVARMGNKSIEKPVLSEAGDYLGLIALANIGRDPDGTRVLSHHYFHIATGAGSNTETIAFIRAMV